MNSQVDLLQRSKLALRCITGFSLRPSGELNQFWNFEHHAHTTQVVQPVGYGRVIWPKRLFINGQRTLEIDKSLFQQSSLRKLDESIFSSDGYTVWALT